MTKITRTVAAIATFGTALALGTGVSAAGPEKEKIEKTGAFVCEGELPPEHCINVKSQGKTGIILVTNGDPRWPAESWSTDPATDSRPCPHDPDADPDGTWWNVPDTPLYVCHHKP